MGQSRGPGKHGDNMGVGEPNRKGNPDDGSQNNHGKPGDGNPGHQGKHDGEAGLGRSKQPRSNMGHSGEQTEGGDKGGTGETCGHGGPHEKRGKKNHNGHHKAGSGGKHGWDS